MGTTLDEPLYYVNSMRILVRTGLRFYLIFTHLLKAIQVFGAIVEEKFSVDIDNNALDITLDQFFFNTFFLFFIFFIYFFILPILHLCLLLGLYCFFVVSGG